MKPISFFGLDLGTATVIRDLRIRFDVTKNLESTPNTCELTIYNMSRESRARVETLPLHVRIDAGYAGAMHQVFSGDVTWARSTRSGREWETKILLGDGSRALNVARIAKTYRAGTNAKQVLMDAAEAMGLRVPTSADQIPELLTQFPTGHAIEGAAHRAVTSVLRSQGISWSIQDGEMQLLRDRDTSAGEAVVIAPPPEGRMLGSPEPLPPDKPGGPQRISVRCVLDSRVRPGGRIMVRSASIPGALYRVEEVRHACDTRGDGAFHTVIEARL